MVSRTFKTIKMKEEINAWAKIMDKIAEVQNETEEEIEYTCCNVEITQEIKEVGFCPKCLEHI